MPASGDAILPRAAGLAQLVEHIIRNDGVRCSSHLTGTIFLRKAPQIAYLRGFFCGDGPNSAEPHSAGRHAAIHRALCRGVCMPKSRRRSGLITAKEIEKNT